MPTSPPQDRAHRRTFAAGETLFRQGEPADAAYIVESGAVSVEREDRGWSRKVASLGVGDLVGESALTDGARRLATAIAVEDTEVFVVDRALLRRRLRAADPMLRLLLRAVLERLRDSHSWLTGVPTTKRPEQAAGGRERRAIGAVKFEHELRRGLAGGELALTLQPIVALASGRPVGFEALMAWNHPTRGLLSPTSFIETAERTGLVRELDDLALRLAARAMRRLGDGAAAEALRVSVNLSGVHADDRGTAERVRRIIEEESLPAARLTLEVTESWLVNDPERAQEVLSRLKDLGLRLALDDFGTGYSSLGYLHRFPIDYLKVDRSFTRGLPGDADSARIARAVVGLAGSFGLQAIAEGIDDPAAIPMLREMGCEFGQGYYFSRPLTPAEAADYVRRAGGPPD